VQQKETYNCEVPPSPAISQGFLAERKKSLMYAYRLEEGYMIKHDPKLNTHHPICNVINLNKFALHYLSHQSYS